VLEKKFDDFLLSVTDEKTKDLMKNNHIITGGCIASIGRGYIIRRIFTQTPTKCHK
jgi:hypothetical protein